jgi:hypothetical protein
MTVTELAFAVVAAAMLAIGISVVVLVRRLLPVIDRAQILLRRSSATLARIQRVAADAEAMSRDARHLEGRVSSTAHGLLDQVEPPLHILGAVTAGARAAVGALFRRRDRTREPQTPSTQRSSS